jgi:hypothetical protein
MARASKVSSENMTNSSEYISNGVYLTPATPTSGDKAKIIYDGLLSKSGASDILVRVGFGNNWDRLYDYRMNRTNTGFETTIPVAEADTLNVCFKDCANNWDNNSGRNYSFDIVQ